MDNEPRVLRDDYLTARSQAYEHREHMDPMLGDYLFVHRKGVGDFITLMCWFAFMAGSDWERSWDGPRYVEP